MQGFTTETQMYFPPSCINNLGNEFHPQFIPLTIFNLSKVDHFYIGRDTVVAFADKPAVDVYHVEIASDEKIKEHQPSQGIGYHSITKHYQKFLVTPLLYVHLQMYQATTRFISRTRKSRQTFTRGLKNCVKSMVKHSPNTLHNEDISRTKLVKMDIDTGDSPPVSSRPYELQQEVLAEGKKRGQISLHPLPKIDEMYAKLKGTKVFSTIDLRSRYYHIALGKDSRAKTAFVTPFGKYKFLMVPFGLAQAPAYFQLLMN